MPLDRKFKRELKKFFEKLHQERSEKAILDENVPVEKVLEDFFEFKTDKEKNKLKTEILMFRRQGKVDWKKKIEVL